MRSHCGVLYGVCKAMVITEDEVVDVGDGSDDAIPNYLGLAFLLRDMLRDGKAGLGDGDLVLTEILEYAALEFGIESDGHANKSVKRRKESRDGATDGEQCRHFCCDHEELMNPKLWGALRREILEMVFSYLPVDEISRLRFLSKEWKHTLDTADSEFYRVCDKVGGKMMCLITRSENLFCARVLDTKLGKWYTYPINVGRSANSDLNGTKCIDVVSEDAGFVCFTTSFNFDSKRKKARPSLLVSIANPLTKIVIELPTLFDFWHISLVQLKMDRENKAFKVFVLASKARWTRGERSSYWESAGVALQIFDSLTGEWTTVCDNSSDQLLFGHKKFFMEKDSAYDVANRQLLNLSSYDFRIWRRDSFSARYKDRLFVLQMGLDGPANEALAIQSPTSYILEFRLQRREGRRSWLKVETHRCNPFEHPPGKADGEYYMEMYSCDGF